MANLDGKKYYWVYTDRKRGKHVSRSFANLAEAKRYAAPLRGGWMQADLWDKSNPFGHQMVGYIGTSGKWWGYSKKTGNMSAQSGRSREIRIFP